MVAEKPSWCIWENAPTRLHAEGARRAITQEGLPAVEGYVQPSNLGVGNRLVRRKPSWCTWDVHVRQLGGDAAMKCETKWCRGDADMFVTTLVWVCAPVGLCIPQILLLEIFSQKNAIRLSISLTVSECSSPRLLNRSLSC